MKIVLAIGAICAAGAVAQEHDIVFEKMVPQVRVMSLQGGVMGRTVKGAPYSGVEISEHTQMLADGTRIHNESQTQVYRDSEGRMRRETPNEITIWDPVANASWVLNPKAQTARKLPMGTFFYSATNKGPSGEVMTHVLRAETVAVARGGGAGGAEVNRARREVELAQMMETRNAEARLKADIEKELRTGGTGGGVFVAAPPEAMVKKTLGAQKVNQEALGKRMIEGVNADGTRMTATVDAGAIGNDRAINTVTERWYSQELQTVMLTRTTDPRSGEDVFKLVNVTRSEPAAYLFQVPAGYQIVDAR